MSSETIVWIENCHKHLHNSSVIFLHAQHAPLWPGRGVLPEYWMEECLPGEDQKGWLSIHQKNPAGFSCPMLNYQFPHWYTMMTLLISNVLFLDDKRKITFMNIIGCPLYKISGKRKVRSSFPKVRCLCRNEFKMKHSML